MESPITENQPIKLFQSLFQFCIKPRKTINLVLESTLPQYSLFIFIIGALSGYFQTFIYQDERALSYPLTPGYLIVMGFMLFVFSILGFYLSGFLLRWSGSWFGGKAFGSEVKAVISWSYSPVLLFGYPIIFFLVFLKIIGLIGLLPEILFAIFFILFALFYTALGIWSFVILLLGLSEVHGISTWKVLLGYVLVNLLFSAPFFCILGIIVF